MRAEDVMTTPAPAVRAHAPIAVAAELMLAHHCPALPVVDELDRLIGIVGDGDVLLHDLGDRRRGPATVADLMTREVLAVPRHLELGELRRRLVSGGRRLVPVVDGERLVGIVTRRDLLRLRSTGAR
jgi:CBS domain-containing protein